MLQLQRMPCMAVMRMGRHKAAKDVYRVQGKVRDLHCFPGKGAVMPGFPALLSFREQFLHKKRTEPSTQALNGRPSVLVAAMIV